MHISLTSTRCPRSRSSSRAASGRKEAGASTSRLVGSRSFSLALEVVTDELRKRIGQTFTLDELTSVYERADDWVRVVLAERAPFPGWPRSATTIEEAAFHRYARGATDYTP